MSAATFKTLLQEYEEPLRYHLLRWLQPADVQDVIQEAYERMWQMLPRRDIEHPRAYLFRTAENIATDLLRKNARRHRLLASKSQAASESISPEQNLDAAEMQAELMGVYANLGPMAQRVFYLRRIKGLDTEQIAAELRISRRMVQKHMASVLKRMREAIAEMRPAG